MKIIYTLIVIQWLCFGLMAQNPVMPMGDGTEASPYQIGNLENLYWITVNPQNWDKHFVQTANIDASETRNWFDGKGWIPIGVGEDMPAFSGIYDGKNFSITHLVINLPNNWYVGLFGAIDSGTVKNLGVTNALVYGGFEVGILAGRLSFDSRIDNCFTTGRVYTLKGSIGGGLVGFCQCNSLISNSNSGADVYGKSYLGGLVGYLLDAFIENCSATGYVNGDANVGGLVGASRDDSFIKTSYSSGVVSGNGAVGGLVGRNYGALISNCYSKAHVKGKIAGGLIGLNFGSIIHCYATGKVQTHEENGGLVGLKWAWDGWEGEMLDANNYWNIQTSGHYASAMGQGRTTGQMTVPFAKNTYVGWDFKRIWKADAQYNDGYPYLSWQQFDEDPITCAMGQGYWFARPQTQWPCDVAIGGHSFSQKEAKKKFWPANTNTKRAFTQYASVYLSGTTVNHFPALEKSMKAIEHYFTHQYPAPAGKEVNKAASDIGKWIDRNSCEKDNLKAEMVNNEPELINSDRINIYPNPFSDRVFIEFTPEKDAIVSMTINNVLGEQIAVLFDNYVQAYQTYQVVFDASSLPGGVYIHRMLIDNELHINKLFLIR